MMIHDYQNKIQSYGFKKLSGGLYSTVYGHDEADFVIKIASGDYWPQYIAWATKNGYAGNFAPKVYSLKYYNDKNNGTQFYVAIMERLAAVVGDIKGEESDRSTRRGKHYMPSGIVRQYYEFLDALKGRQTDCEYGDMILFAWALKHWGHANDTHEWNFMVRKDGHFVCIDPSSKRDVIPVRIKNASVVALA